MLTPSSQGNQKASARAAGAPRRAVGAAALPPLQATRLLEQVRERVRGLHYSLRTEEAYVFWCRDFVRFHGLRHPVEMGGPEVEAFLTHLAAQRGLSVSSHRQALSALLFLYGKVLGQQLPWMDEIGRPVPKRRLPVVLSAQEVAAVLAELDGVHGLLARLLYGTGLRIEEALRLRVKDLDFAHQAILKTIAGPSPSAGGRPESRSQPLAAGFAIAPRSRRAGPAAGPSRAARSAASGSARAARFVN
jgi:integrase